MSVGRHFLFGSVMSAALLAWAGVASCQTGAGGWAASVKSAAAVSAAERSGAPQTYDEGVQAFQAGQHALAIEKLTLALSTGSLKTVQSAHALYFRGVAYRALKRPDLAVPDLTNALLKKGGLSQQERADALQHRAAAFREGGLSDQADPPDVKQVSKVRASQGDAPQIVAAPHAAPAAGASAEASAPAPTGSSGGLLGFMSSLISPQPQAASQPAPNVAAGTSGPWVTTGSTGAMKPSPVPIPAQQAAPAVAVPQAAAVPVQPVVAKPAPAPAAAGSWRLQLSAQRDKKLAEASLAKIRAKHAVLGKKQATIEQANVGGMGAFWLTRVGPFSDQREAQDLCAAIRANGVDCFVSSD